MNWLSSEIVTVLGYLLPGFVAAWLFFGLTAHPRPSPFERLVQALVFTILISGAVVLVEQLSYFVGRKAGVLGEWSQDTQIAWSVIVALFMGLGLSYSANNDSLHRLLREIDITRETSLPSEWYGNFAEPTTYIVLHLVGERRLYGWPKEWPSSPTTGHFALVDAEWLPDDEAGESIPLKGVRTVLVPASEVTFVEFMTPLPEEEESP